MHQSNVNDIQCLNSVTLRLANSYYQLFSNEVCEIACHDFNTKNSCLK